MAARGGLGLRRSTIATSTVTTGGRRGDQACQLDPDGDERVEYPLFSARRLLSVYEDEKDGDDGARSGGGGGGGSRGARQSGTTGRRSGGSGGSADSDPTGYRTTRSRSRSRSSLHSAAVAAAARGGSSGPGTDSAAGVGAGAGGGGGASGGGGGGPAGSMLIGGAGGGGGGSGSAVGGGTVATGGFVDYSPLSFASAITARLGAAARTFLEGTAPAERRSTVGLAAVGGTRAQSFLALYVADSTLVLRGNDSEGPPTTKQLLWPQAEGARAVALCFDPSGEWLAVATAGQGIVLVPVAGLLGLQPATGASVGPDGESLETERLPSLKSFAGANGGGGSGDGGDGDRGADSLGPSTDVSLIRDARSNPVPEITVCTWWQSWTGDHFVVLGDDGGNISFINLKTRREVAALRLGHNMTGLDVVINSQEANKYLLIHGKQKYWKLPLEQEVDYQIYNTMPGNLGTAPFVLKHLDRFQDCTHVAVHLSARQGYLISAFSPKNNHLEVYDASISRFPLYVFQMIGSVDAVALLDRYTVVVPSQPFGTAAVLVSNLIAGASCHTNLFEDDRASLERTIMQTYPLNGERVRGVLGPLRDTSGAESGSGAESPPRLWIWTEGGVYELGPDVPADVVFDRLLADSFEAAERLGKAAGLDLYSMYETAADDAFAAGHYERALELYQLSNVQMEKLIKSYLSVSRVSMALDYITNVIESQAAVLSIGARRRYSDLALSCHVLTLMEDDCLLPWAADGVETPTGRQAAFETFLRGNTHYDVRKAVDDLAPCGAAYLCLVIGLERDAVPTALGALAAFGVPLGFQMTKQAARALASSNYADFLSVPVPTALAALRASRNALIAAASVTLPLLLPQLSESGIVALASAAWPLETSAAESHDGTAHAHHTPAADMIVGKEHLYYEVFFEVVLALEYFRQSESSKLAGGGEAATTGGAAAAATASRAESECVARLPGRPWFSSTTELSSMFNRRELEEDLVELAGRYRPSVIIARAIDYGNYNAAAVVYETLEEWTSVFDCRLAALAAGGLGAENEMKRALAVFDAVLEHLVATDDVDHILELLCVCLKYWCERNHPVSALEDFFRANLAVFSQPLALLLETAESEELPWLLPFSHSLYLDVAVARIEHLKAAAETSGGTGMGPRVNAERLRSEIRDNLSKDVDKRAQLVVVPSSLDNATNAVVAFTCGCNYDEWEYSEQVLPQFRSRVADLPVDLPLTSSIIIQDYNQDYMSHACPVCTYNTLRGDHAPELRLWIWGSATG